MSSGFRFFFLINLLGTSILLPGHLAPDSGAAADAAVSAGLAAGAGVEDLLKSPRVISSSVSREKREGKSLWIDMTVDVHGCTEVPRERLLAVLNDTDNYSRVFKRIRAASFGSTGEGVYRDMRMSIGLLGFSFETNYTLLFRETLNTAGAYRLTFTHAGDDGTVKDVHGFWYFESLEISGESYTYVRYYSSCRVLRKFPFQRMIMSMFNGQENIDMMHQLFRAAARGIDP
jgi:hypothetical protein